MHIVVDGELALLLKEQDRRGGELLGHGGHMEDRLRRDGDVVVEVGHAVAVLVDDLAVLVDAQRAAGRIGAVPLLEDLVHLRGEIGRERLRGARQEARKMAGRASSVGIRFMIFPLGVSCRAKFDSDNSHRLGPRAQGEIAVLEPIS